MNDKKILLLTEGEKLEKELFTHLYLLYDIKNVQIIPYKTNIYNFYHRLLKDYGRDGEINFDVIDIPLFLNEYFGWEQGDLLNRDDFSDILLVYDFDPHDSNYSPEKIIKLLNHFNESTDNGKLYINYPMIESFQHIKSINDPSFFESMITLNDLTKRYRGSSYYKKEVKENTFISKIDEIDKMIMKQLIDMHNTKFKEIIKRNKPTNSIDEEKKFIDFCDIQCKKLDNSSEMWILNTSLLYMIDEYGELK